MSEENQNKPQNDSNEKQNISKDQPRAAISNPINYRPIALYAVLTAVILAILYLLLQLLGIINGPEPPTITYFAEDQLIITGNLDTITSTLSTIEADTELQVTFTLVNPQNDRDKIPDFMRSDNINSEGALGSTQLGARNSNGKLLFQTANENTNIFLFRVTFLNNTTSLNDVLAAIQTSGLTSDLNYAIGRAPLEIEGDPDCGEGFAIAEKDTIDAISEEEARAQFYNQWAFKNLNLFTEESQNGERPPTTFPETIQGADVWVAMFDTSPFDLHGERLLDTDLPTIDFGNDIVNHFETIGDPDARDHGIYGASLVHEIAPGADIRFYRVLDQSNRGDLFTLLRALETLQKNWIEAGQPPLVINMSLGVHPSPESKEAQELVTLEKILNDFYEAKAVIVAASGNDSAQSYRDNSDRLNPVAMQIPADYPMVIGVGASNQQNTYSCFSNAGDILAPGGENGEAEGQQCMSVVANCNEDPSKCLIGYVYTPDNAHYAYWTGTSFAAPMVSGAAALLLGEGLTNEQVYEALAPHLLGQISDNAVEGVVEPAVLDLAAIIGGD